MIIFAGYERHRFYPHTHNRNAALRRLSRCCTTLLWASFRTLVARVDMWIKSFSISFAAYRTLAFYGFRSSFCQGYMNGFAALYFLCLLYAFYVFFIRFYSLIISFICRLLHRAVARSARFRQEGR